MKNWLLAGCIIFTVVWLSLFVIPVPEHVPTLPDASELGTLSSAGDLAELWTLFPLDLIAGVLGLFLGGLVLNVYRPVLPERKFVIPAWSYDGVISSIVWILTAMGAGFAASKYAANYLTDPFYFRWGTSLVLQVMLLLSVPLLVRVFGESFGESFGDVTDWLNALTHGTVEYVRIYPILLLTLFCNQLLLLKLNYTAPPSSYLFILTADTVPKTVYLVLLTCLIAPVGEELFFRGILYRSLRDIVGRRSSALGAGLIFALVHFEIQLFIPLLVLGYLLCVIYEKCGSVKVVITMHFLQNTISLLIFYRLL